MRTRAFDQSYDGQWDETDEGIGVGMAIIMICFILVLKIPFAESSLSWAMSLHDRFQAHLAEADWVGI